MQDRHVTRGRNLQLWSPQRLILHWAGWKPPSCPPWQCAPSTEAAFHRRAVDVGGGLTMLYASVAVTATRTDPRRV